jgi:hypothetical protein
MAKKRVVLFLSDDTLRALGAYTRAHPTFKSDSQSADHLLGEGLLSAHAPSLLDTFREAVRYELAGALQGSFPSLGAPAATEGRADGVPTARTS